MKTGIVSVNWPVWEWKENPERRWIFTAYSGSLSTIHSRRRRQIIKSDWFQARWGEKFQLVDDQDQKTFFENDHGGFLLATSSGGTTGGKHGDRLVADDPINPESGDSKAEREKGNAHVEYLFTTRARDQKRSARILIMQRVHHDDAVARMAQINEKLAKRGVVLENHCTITLPSIARETNVFVFPRSGRTFERKEGDLLWPEKFNRNDLESIRERFGSFKFAAQHGQNPSPEGGGIISASWWRTYKEPPRVFDRIGWYWDTAQKKGEMNDYSAGVLMGRTEKGIYILNVINKRLLYPELKREVGWAFSGGPATFVMIENKVSGSDLIPDLKEKGMPVIGFEVGGRDKVQRASLVSAVIESGTVFISEDSDWAHTLVEQFSEFPNGKFDDIVDAVVMGLHDLCIRSKKIGDFLEGSDKPDTDYKVHRIAERPKW